MDYQELKKLTGEVPEGDKKAYHRLMEYACVGGGVKGKYAKQLEEATTLREFYDAIFAVDEFKFDDVWGQWAKVDKKRWVDHFEAVQSRLIQLRQRGIYLQSAKGDNELLIPFPARNNYIDVCVFDDGKINEKCGELYGSINGSFTCFDVELEGAFDIYLGHLAIVFERWSVDSMNAREGRGAISAGCKCFKIWDSLDGK